MALSSIPNLRKLCQAESMHLTVAAERKGALERLWPPPTFKGEEQSPSTIVILDTTKVSHD